MGFLANALTLDRKSLGTLVPSWENGRPQQRDTGIDFRRGYLEGFAGNEVVYACLEILADSATEPTLRAERGSFDEPEVLPMHPAVQFLENPNPEFSVEEMIGLVEVDLGIAGNSYQKIEYSRRGLPVEYWRLRPDRVEVIPDRDKFIRGYLYRIGNEEHFLERRDVIHHRARDPYSDYYGMPWIMAAAGRIDLDNWMRTFARSFFEHAGIPSGMLIMNRILSRQDKRDVRTMWRQENGPGNWNNLVVIDGDGTAKYQPMGASLADSGAAMPSLDEINETRIAAAARIPQSLVGTRLGNQSAAYANRKADQEHFWRTRQIPEYKRLAGTFTRALKPFFPDLERLTFDVTKVAALSEDQSELHNRIRLDFTAGLIGQEEARSRLRYPSKIPADDVFMVASSVLPTLGADLVTEEEPPEPVTPGLEPPPPPPDPNDPANQQSPA